MYDRLQYVLGLDNPLCGAAFGGAVDDLSGRAGERTRQGWSAAACLLLGALLEERAPEARYPVRPAKWTQPDATGGGQAAGLARGKSLTEVLDTLGRPLDDIERRLLAAIATSWQVRWHGEEVPDVRWWALGELLAVTGATGALDAAVASSAIPIAMQAVRVEDDDAALAGCKTWLECDMLWLERLAGGLRDHAWRAVDACVASGIGNANGHTSIACERLAARAVLMKTFAYFDADEEERVRDEAAGVARRDFAPGEAHAGARLAGKVLRLWCAALGVRGDLRAWPDDDSRVRVADVRMAKALANAAEAWSAGDWGAAAETLGCVAWRRFLDESLAVPEAGRRPMARLALLWEPALMAGAGQVRLAAAGGARARRLA